MQPSTRTHTHAHTQAGTVPAQLVHLWLNNTIVNVSN